jgi:gluconate 2-dehydrogenase gamma chain
VWLTILPTTLRTTARAAAGTNPADPYRVLTPEEAETLSAVTAQIIPSDDTPGAREAQVVRFLDLSLAGFAKEELPLYRSGVVELNAKARRLDPSAASFAGLPDEKQAELLRSLESAASPFFESVLAATLTGMFADPEYGGNRDKIGWRLIGFEDRFAWGPPFGDYDA